MNRRSSPVKPTGRGVSTVASRRGVASKQVVHMTFASAYTQLAAGENLGDLVAREGDWRHCQAELFASSRIRGRKDMEG